LASARGLPVTRCPGCLRSRRPRDGS
jgi:hypothetical protein